MYRYEFSAISRKGSSVQEALATFEESPSENNSAASSNSDKDSITNLTQGENIISNSDDNETDDLQHPSTSNFLH